MFDSSHISWRCPQPEAALAASLAALGSSLAELPSQTWDPKTSTVGGVRDIELATLAPRPDAWSFVLLPLRSELGPALAAALSNQVADPVMLLLEHDQAAWGFRVYAKGRELARFWNDPDLIEDELDEAASVTPETIASLFSVPIESVAPYLQPLADLGPDPRAFADDEFTLADHWVRCDFMRRLGMDYPDPGSPGARWVQLQSRR